MAKRQQLFEVELMERQEKIKTQQLAQKYLNEKICALREGEREMRMNQRAEHQMRLALLQKKLAIKDIQLKMLEEQAPPPPPSISSQSTTSTDISEHHDFDYEDWPNSQQISPTTLI